MYPFVDTLIVDSNTSLQKKITKETEYETSIVNNVINKPN